MDFEKWRHIETLHILTCTDTLVAPMLRTLAETYVKKVSL